MKRFFQFLMLLATMVLSLYSCADDDSFSDSPSHFLTFSEDSVRLDTVFSRVPTATKTFWAYNKSGDGIRCQSVRLEKGNQTGYRVNVDGTYLGSSAGYQVSDIEIRNKDSIRVFVELTSPANNKETPTLLEDNLIFQLESGNVQKVNLSAYTWDADMLKDVVIEQNTTWQQAKPIVIYGGITVKEGATLTIGEGTTLYFHENAGMEVYGRLVVQGSVDNNVVLRGDRIDHMFDYLPYDRVSGQWQGIHFHSSSYDNDIFYADIHSTYNAFVCDSSDVSRLKLNFYNSVIHNCQGYGLLAYHSVVDVVNSQITNTLNDCVAFYGGVSRILQCTIAQFYPFDANRGAALRFANYQDDNIYPLYDFSCVNSIVTGYADDEVYGNPAGETLNLNFYNCVLLTDVSDATYFHDCISESKDSETYKQKNFKTFDTHAYIYDLRLDSASVARGKASTTYSALYPIDRYGVERGEKPDAGCYQYQEK